MKTWYVYMMASISRTLYIGVTNDLGRRVAEHKSGEVDGFTKRYRVHKSVYYEEFGRPRDAIERETTQRIATREENRARGVFQPNMA